MFFFFFSSRRRHTRYWRDWSSDVCSSDLRLSTGQRVTLLSLDRGLAYFTGEPQGKDALTLAVPGAQVTFIRGARVRLEAQDTWSRILVIEGTVRFSSPAAEMDLHEGQSVRRSEERRVG